MTEEMNCRYVSKLNRVCSETEPTTLADQLARPEIIVLLIVLAVLVIAYLIAKK